MPRSPRFTLEQIQRAALEIVDQDGLDALTMRSLARALGTGPMTIYNYLDGKTGLEELVVDAVSVAIELPKSTGSWRADTEAVSTAIWRALRAHPAVIPLVLIRRTSSAATLRPAEALASALAHSGLSGWTLLVAFRTVFGFVTGIAQAELSGPLTPIFEAEQEAARMKALTQGAHPTLARLAELAGADPEREFRDGLTVVLHGIEAAKGRT